MVRRRVERDLTRARYVPFERGALFVRGALFARGTLCARGAFFGALLLGFVGCDGSTRAQEPEPGRAPQQEKTPSTASSPAPERAAPPPEKPPSEPAAPASRDYAFPAAPRIVAIGDLHGDIESTRAALRLAGATDEKDRWVGRDLVVVQTGDQLDRGDGERLILELLDRLQAEAKAAGGALHVLNGNHETMNVLGDFRYVTRGALHAFDDLPGPSPLASRYPLDFRGRAGAFLPGGPMARRLAERRLIVQVGDVVFVHGGVRAPHVAHGIDRLNTEAAAWMRGEAPPPLLVQDPEGPLWTRVYGAPVLDEAACRVLDAALERLGARMMVVGHSVQPEGVAAGCGGKVHRIDVGLSRYYGQGPIQVLEIRGEEARVLSAPRPPGKAPSP